LIGMRLKSREEASIVWFSGSNPTVLCEVVHALAFMGGFFECGDVAVWAWVGRG